MRTVDPETWFKNVKKSKSIFRSLAFTHKRGGDLEWQLRCSFMDAIKEFWVNSSIRGQKYLRMDDTHKFARRTYTFVFAAVLIFGVSVVARNGAAYRHRPPLSISELSSQYSVRNVDFPAVALCSYNLISRAALREFALELNSKDKNRSYTLQEIERNLRHFGALSDMSLPSVDVHFMRFLDEIGGEQNVSNIIFRLSPRCEDLLVRCTWRAHRVPCALLFAARATPHGFCCVFNSRYQLEDINTPVKKLDLVGRDTGLGVVIRENSNDFTYLRRPYHGIEVLIWDGSEYPMTQGGAVQSLATECNTSAFISIGASVQRADPSLDYINENWRGCRMPQPLQASAWLRSRAWCLLQCRLAAVRALCACTPHAYVALLPRRPRTLCSLEHLACLHKHREKFVYYKPGAADEADGASWAGLREEALDALPCAHCRPDCARTRFSARLSYTTYQHLDKVFKNLLSSNVTFVNTTVIRMFYGREDQKLFLIETNSRWYEIIATLSSQWVYLVGATLISWLELAFHCGVRWRHHFLRRRHADVNSRRLWSRINKTLRP